MNVDFKDINFSTTQEIKVIQATAIISPQQENIREYNLNFNNIIPLFIDFTNKDNYEINIEGAPFSFQDTEEEKICGFYVIEDGVLKVNLFQTYKEQIQIQLRLAYIEL